MDLQIGDVFVLGKLSDMAVMISEDPVAKAKFDADVRAMWQKADAMLADEAAMERLRNRPRKNGKSA